MTNPQHVADTSDASDSRESHWEPKRWYSTIGGALTTVYADSQGEHDYRCAGCGERGQRSKNIKTIQVNANDHAASCHSAPDPRIQQALEIARSITMDVSAELPRIDAKAAAGTALSVALIVGLVSTQKPSASPVFVAAVIGGVFLTIALLLFLAALLTDRTSAVGRSGSGQGRHQSSDFLLADLLQRDKSAYYASVAVELSGAARAKSRRLQLGIYASAFAVTSFVFGVGIYFVGGSP
jgi:hypothetical protein